MSLGFETNKDVTFTTASGSGGTVFNTGSRGFIFNELGADTDFRVETSNKPNAFRVDGGDDQVRTDAVFVHDADGSNQPFYITRSGGLDQGLKVTVDDNNVMLTSVQDETSGANFVFYSTNATASNINMLQLDYSAGAVFNEGGKNYQNFRIESNVNTHAFYLNAVNGNIGLNAGAAPHQPLTIGATAGANLNYYSGTANVISSASGIKVSKNIANDAGAGSGLNLSNSASTNGTMSPIIHFSAKSASNTYNTTYAGIWGRKLSNGTDTNWNVGSIEFGTAHSAGIHKKMELDYLGGLITTPITGGHAVFNEGGVDADFRVESDADSHALFVDSSANTVFIKTTTSPATGTDLVVDKSYGIGGQTTKTYVTVINAVGNSTHNIGTFTGSAGNTCSAHLMGAHHYSTASNGTSAPVSVYQKMAVTRLDGSGSAYASMNNVEIGASSQGGASPPTFQFSSAGVLQVITGVHQGCYAQITVIHHGTFTPA
jgi:hypothetical protein